MYSYREMPALEACQILNSSFECHVGVRTYRTI